ncbi:MAG: nucleotide exchange factor GrpE, partial [Chloroflexi bacterium]|nr:nucleotide exchange factor GrpE [Chloroflexota bacterium]
ADDFSNALETAEDQNMDPKWFNGFKAMAEKIEKGLTDAGFRRFESIGHDMDPARHEALATMPTSDDQAGKVVQEIEAGYEDIETSRVVRVAKVLVGRRSDDSESN